jgi:hypothetical protein
MAVAHAFVRARAADRRVLALPYATILVAEAASLATMAVGFYPHLPYAYELGWAGVASMLVMQLYSVRRRVRCLARFGSLHAWLEAHIFLGVQGFIFVAYHAASISSSASLAALDLALVAIVVATGIIGRYLYGRIARAAHHSRALAIAERWFARWTLFHRPLAVLLLGITILHVLAHFAYAV